MKKILKYVLPVSLLTIGAASWAGESIPAVFESNNTQEQTQDQDQDKAISVLQEKLIATTSVKSRFYQVIHDDVGAVVDESHGEFHLARPNKFKWIVQDPYEQEIVSDGKDLWQFDRDIEQITRSDLDETLANSPAGLLSQTELDLASKYRVSMAQTESESITIFTLHPLAEDALYEELMIEFNGEDFKALHIRDNLGQSTLVEFSEVETNSEFPEQHFKFVVPEDVDLIDSRTNNPTN